ITQERLYIDAMESVYSRSQKVMVDVDSGGNNVLYLPLDRMRGSGNAPRVDLNNLNYPTTNNPQSTSNSSAQDGSRSRGGR
ncbi:MAG TPA: protease modulator HflK, partial [Methylophaga sp.]|nr:protease modulator HflK [Methylophaga sp.]